MLSRFFIMRAMQLRQPRQGLVPVDLESPAPGPGQLSVRVQACGVCRTDLHVLDGELPNPRLPLILGHEVVGRVLACAPQAARVPVETSSVEYSLLDANRALADLRAGLFQGAAVLRV